MNNSEEGTALYRTKRKIRKPTRYRVDESVSYALSYAQDCPSSYNDAMESNEKSKWQQAMNEEFDSLMKNNTWDLV